MSASAKKIKVIDLPEDVEGPDCNIIINSSLLMTLLQKLTKCPQCNEKVNIRHSIKCPLDLPTFLVSNVYLVIGLIVFQHRKL